MGDLTEVWPSRLYLLVVLFSYAIIEGYEQKHFK